MYIICVRPRVQFVISVVDMAALGAKPIKVAPAAAALSSDRATGPVDAFAAVEPELFVADVGSEYMLLLNKFPVLREHVSAPPASRPM